MLKRLKEDKRESKRSFLELSLKYFTIKLPHTINPVDVLYNLFKMDSNLFKKISKISYRGSINTNYSKAA